MIAFGVAALFLATAQSGQWEMIGVTKTGIRVFVDPSSIAIAGPVRAATIRLGSPRSLAGPIVETRQYERFDCGNRRWALLGYEAYDENGKVVSRKPPGAGPVRMEPVVADTLGETVFDYVCAWRPEDPARPIIQPTGP